MSLVEATANIDFDTRMVRGIEASFVLRDRKSPINGGRVSVSWEEYPVDNASQDHPDVADAGSFDARVPKVAADPSGCNLYLYLRYTQQDARNFLVPLLLSRPVGLAVEMDTVLLADARTMHVEPEGSTGQVAKYALRLSRTGD